MKSTIKDLTFQEMLNPQVSGKFRVNFLKSLFQKKEMTEKELKKSLSLHQAEQLLAENKERCLRMSRSPWM